MGKTRRASPLPLVILDRLRDDPALAARVLAVCEPEPPKVAITTPARAAAVVEPLLIGLDHEELIVVALDRRSRVIATIAITRGSDQFTVVCPRQVFRWALQQGRSGAAAIILAHNHPSGDPTPSEQDREVTRKVAAAGRVLQITLLDHMIIGGPGAWTSLAEQGELPSY